MHDQQEFIKDLTQLSSKIPTRSNGAEFKCFLRIDRWFCHQNAPKLTRMALGLKVRSGRWFSLFHRPIYINYTVMVMAIYINLLVLTGYKWGYILIP